MPPTVNDIVPCRTGGPEARPWLEYLGLTARVPDIRSSDLNLALSDPFTYYLRRRLGLAPALAWSEALTFGSWFHSLSEADNYTKPLDDAGLHGHLNRLLIRRKAELDEIARRFNIIGETRQNLLSKEEEHARMVHCWYTASASVTISETVGTWRSFLARSYWRVLGREVPLRIEVLPGVWAAIRIDLLLYHEIHKTLWVVDFKTTSLPPALRAQTCPHEFQSQLYMDVLSRKLPDFVREFGLPTETKVRGIAHIIIGKPGIRISGQDRDCKFVDFTPKTGKNKGITRQEKEFYGEPKFENYLNRVRDWYLASGEYTHLAREREALPPHGTGPIVNISFTDSDAVEAPHLRPRYTQRLNFLAELSRRDPFPDNFVRAERITGKDGEASAWTDFHTTDPSQWAEVIQKHKLIVAHRDEDLGDPNASEEA